MIINLGKAWASNTINTVIFRQSGLVTSGQFQYCSYYLDEKNIRFVKRNLLNDNIETYDLQGAYNLKDAHNSISMGVDDEGFIHISYQQHGSVLKYRRTNIPFDIHSWSNEISMTGEYEKSVTYPCFLNLHRNKKLLFLYRDGKVENATMRLKSWSSSNQHWEDLENPVLQGADQKPWSSNPYWNAPAVSLDDVIHLSFTWRTHSSDSADLINNINIDYAKSPDHGQKWFSSKEKLFLLPITQVNSETIFPISPSSNLINQSGMAVDKDGKPHIVFYSDDLEGIPQYQHLWFDGKSWKHQIITKRETPFILKGKGTLQIPISRPEIIIDKKNIVYIIYRGDFTGNHLIAHRFLPPDYDLDHSDQIPLTEEPVGYSEPIIDRNRWIRDGKLSMLLQKNDQPNQEGNFIKTYEPIKILDFDILAYKSDSKQTDIRKNENQAISLWLEEATTSVQKTINRMRNQQLTIEDLKNKLSSKDLLIEDLSNEIQEIKRSKVYQFGIFLRRIKEKTNFKK